MTTNISMMIKMNNNWGEWDEEGQCWKQPPQEPVASPTTNTNQKYKESDSVVFPKLPDKRGMRNYKTQCVRIVIAASGRPKEAATWFRYTETAETIEDLADDGKFETLSAKIASALQFTIHASFKRDIQAIDERRYIENLPFLNGRQLYFMILHEFDRSPVDDSIPDRHEGRFEAVPEHLGQSSLSPRNRP
jgi:hypothetical protein